MSTYELGAWESIIQSIVQAFHIVVFSKFMKVLYRPYDESTVFLKYLKGKFGASYSLLLTTNSFCTHFFSALCLGSTSAAALFAGRLLIYFSP